MGMSRRGFRLDGKPYENRQRFQEGPRVLPHSMEAEESVLGGVLLDTEAIHTAIEKLRPDDFYRPAHQSIFTAMVELVDRREPIDVVTLTQKLKSLGCLEEVGGVEAVSRLAGLVPNAANIAYYARLVKEASIRRKVIKEATDIISEAFSGEGEVEEFLDKAEKQILGISDQRTGTAFHKVCDVVQKSIKFVETLYDRKEPITGISCGLTDLDLETAGFQPSDLIVIAARPSMGKTALVLGFATHVGVELKKGVAIFSLEMSKEQLVLRMLCSESGVANSRVRTGHLQDRDFPNLVAAAGRLTDAPIYIDDTPGLSIGELRAKCRRLHREQPLSMVMVDYLQLMRSPAYSHSREQEISDISRSLKGLAKELNVPVIALSQLNRSVESRDDKRPRMSDLRESGAIEQDADIIMFIYRDQVYNPETADQGIAELIIAKQRNGPTGTVRVQFLGEQTQFCDIPREAAMDLTAPDGDMGGIDFGPEPF